MARISTMARGHLPSSAGVATVPPMDARKKNTPKKWSLRAWLRRIFKRHTDQSGSQTARRASEDRPSPRSNLTVAEKRMIMKATSGRWYVCRQNHPYLVGNCGVPMEFAVCPTCGECIGGDGYNNTRRSKMIASII